MFLDVIISLPLPYTVRSKSVLVYVALGPRERGAGKTHVRGCIDLE